MALIAVLTGGGTGYASLASTEYVDKKVEAVAPKMEALQTAQEGLGRDVAEMKGTLNMIVRLSTAQHARDERREATAAYEREARAARRRRQPEPPRRPPGPAAKTARRLKVDPDNPLHGLHF